MDVNLIGSNRWMAATLPFVCGLGPRKARALLQVRRVSCSGRARSRLRLHMTLNTSSESNSGRRRA